MTHHDIHVHDSGHGNDLQAPGQGGLSGELCEQGRHRLLVLAIRVPSVGNAHYAPFGLGDGVQNEGQVGTCAVLRLLLLLLLLLGL